MSRDSRSHNEEYDENSDDSDILDADDGDFDQTNSKSKQKEVRSNLRPMTLSLTYTIDGL